MMTQAPKSVLWSGFIVIAGGTCFTVFVILGLLAKFKLENQEKAAEQPGYKALRGQSTLFPDEIDDPIEVGFNSTSATVAQHRYGKRRIAMVTFETGVAYGSIHSIALYYFADNNKWMRFHEFSTRGYRSIDVNVDELAHQISLVGTTPQDSTQVVLIFYDVEAFFWHESR